MCTIKSSRELLGASGEKITENSCVHADFLGVIEGTLGTMITFGQFNCTK